MVDIISSFERLRDTHPLFSHIRTVRSDMPYIIDITLNEADSWFPVLTGSPHAAILPHEWQELPDFARRPVGTGPYQVVCNNDRKLTIRAFDHYYGFRALLDEVSVLVVPELEEKWSAPPCISARTGRSGILSTAGWRKAAISCCTTRVQQKESGKISAAGSTA